jgi:putative salt-induced outer membrane protein
MRKIVLSALAISSLAMAAEDLNALKTHTELGYIETQGNTRTQTFNLDLKATKAFDKHNFSLDADAQYATDDSKIGEDKEIKNKYSAELAYDYSFTKRFSVGYLVGYQYDKFSSFDYQAYTGPSAKYKAIKTDTQSLGLEASILYAQDAYRNSTEDTNNYTAYRTKAVYQYKVLPNLKFNQELSYRASFEHSDNYFATSKSVVTNKISDIFSAGLSYKVDYSNIVGPSTERTDRTFTASVIIDY